VSWRDQADGVGDEGYRWWGLWVNGELRQVQWFNHLPNYTDFSLSYFSSQDEYDVLPVRVVPVTGGIC